MGKVDPRGLRRRMVGKHSLHNPLYENPFYSTTELASLQILVLRRHSYCHGAHESTIGLLSPFLKLATVDRLRQSLKPRLARVFCTRPRRPEIAP